MRQAHATLIRVLGSLLTSLYVLLPPGAHADNAWFEELKDSASDRALHQFLYAMPKGGDLHNHLTGSVHPEWFLELALNSEAKGYRFYTKTRINNCRYGTNEFGPNAYLLLFRNLPEFAYERLPDCEKSEYKPLTEMTEEEQRAWLNAQRLDQDHEGRSEFFEAHWSRIGGLLVNPHLVADTLYYNMRSFGRENMLYLETQVPVRNYYRPDGSPYTPDEVMAIFRERLARPDAKATGVTVRLQWAILRFSPGAEEDLKAAYDFVSRTPEYVGVNMVGREDNDKGYPLRFLDTLRALRHKYSGVNLAIHAGEVDEPNQHVRDTLLLGADRIGHGVNLISDPDTMLLMRNGPYLVEINLISNLLLEYVARYDQHPFPEYLRTGIPVALSTDDRGMWDSTLTDEFFVAVREFDLSWQEIRKLSANSISHGFMEPEVKARLLDTLNKRLDTFEKRFARAADPAKAIDRLSIEPEYRGFLCRKYQVCR